jgi:hypothetical protein
LTALHKSSRLPLREPVLRLPRHWRAGDPRWSEGGFSQEALLHWAKRSLLTAFRQMQKGLSRIIRI